MKHAIQTLVVVLASLTAMPSWAGDDVPVPESAVIDNSISTAALSQLLHTASRYYAFWNTGDESYADEALAPDFKDLNLPQGRPQGPMGPLAASAQFRKAVPDLSLSVKSVFVVGDRVIAQLQFEGHFTGAFGELKGQGQAISFSAVDMYTIKDGRITENWHLEDNLTLMQQLGAVNLN